MWAELRAPGHGLSALRPGLPGGASAAGIRSSTAGTRPGAGGEAGKAANSLSRAVQRPPPTGNAAEVGSWRAAPRSLQKAFRAQAHPPGDQNRPASCTRAAAGLGVSFSRWPLAPPGPPPPLLRELGALRWTRGERGSGAAVPAAPPSPRVASSGAGAVQELMGAGHQE